MPFSTQLHCSQGLPEPRGRQCHVQPWSSSFAPVFTVVWPYFTALVSVLVASFAKVRMTSVAWQTQSSPRPLRYFSYFWHSPHATALLFSTCPGPAGSRLPKRRAASLLGTRAKARSARAMMDFIVAKYSNLRQSV